MNDWKAWIREIAYDRIDQIERQLNANPGVFPEYTAAAGKLDVAMDETDKHPDVKQTARGIPKEPRRGTGRAFR